MLVTFDHHDGVRRRTIGAHPDVEQRIFLALRSDPGPPLKVTSVLGEATFACWGQKEVEATEATEATDRGDRGDR